MLVQRIKGEVKKKKKNLSLSSRTQYFVQILQNDQLPILKE